MNYNDLSKAKNDFSAVPIRPAATVILLRDGEDGLETLLLRRNSKLAFAAGAWVFPGGRFEDVDFEAAGRTDEDSAAPFAAARETLEETGLSTAPESFVYYAHWTTPPGMPKRYATWFYMSELRGDASVEVDGSEIHDHIWTTPANALAKHAALEIEIMPPTFVCLDELQGHNTVESALAYFNRRKVICYAPRFSKLDGVTVALCEGDAGYSDSDATQSGPKHRCLMEPGNWSYERTE